MIHLNPKQVIVALDFDTYDQAMSVCKNLSPEIFRLKVGKQLYSSEGLKKYFFTWCMDDKYSSFGR